MSSIATHLDDIDFRTHAERKKEWKKDFKEWYRTLWKSYKADPTNERLSGQLTMLSSVLWYLLEPSEYKALVRGKIHINQDKFTVRQKKLFISMMAFNGSPYCDKESADTVLSSYLKRAKTIYREFVVDETDLARAIAFNIAASEEQP